MEHEHGPTFRLPVAKTLRYLRVWPRSPAAARSLLSMYVRTILDGVLHPQSFRTVGEHLLGSAPVPVTYDGIRGFVRPESEDLAILTGNHEPDVMAWFEPAAGEVVVDVGAHIGTYTLRGARAGATVFAFEPIPATFEILRANVETNGFERVHLFNHALGSEAGRADLHLPRVLLGRASFGRQYSDATSVQVPIERLDDALPLADLPAIDWLKIDVEGAELEVLRGARAALGRARRVIIEVEHGNEPAAREILLGEYGFRQERLIQQPTQDYWFLTARGSVPGPASS